MQDEVRAAGGANELEPDVPAGDTERAEEADGAGEQPSVPAAAARVLKDGENERL